MVQWKFSFYRICVCNTSYQIQRMLRIFTGNIHYKIIVYQGKWYINHLSRRERERERERERVRERVKTITTVSIMFYKRFYVSQIIIRIAFIIMLPFQEYTPRNVSWLIEMIFRCERNSAQISIVPSYNCSQRYATAHFSGARIRDVLAFIKMYACKNTHFNGALYILVFMPFRT